MVLLNVKYKCPRHGEIKTIIVENMEVYEWNGEEYETTRVWQEKVKCAKCGRILEMNGGQ